MKFHTSKNRTWCRFTAVTVLFLLGMTANAKAGAPSTDGQLVNKIDAMNKAAINCVQGHIDHYADPKNGDPDYEKFQEIKKIGPHTRLAIQEFTAKNHSAINLDGFPHYCEFILFPKIKESFLAAYPDWKNNRGGVLANLGKLDIARIVPFIAGFRSNSAAHEYGHSDITKSSLEEIADEIQADYGKRPSWALTWLIMSASQAVDFYGWDQDAYHAHSAEHDCCEQANVQAAIRQAAIDKGQKDFSALFKRHWKGAVEGRIASEAAMHLGVLSHMIQDLVYHRGITLLQHAGLSYYLGKDPDAPAGSENFPTIKANSIADTTRNIAKKQTKRILRAAIRKMTGAKRNALLDWGRRGEPNEFDYDDRAYGVFGTGVNEPEVLALMGLYVASSWRYVFGVRDPDVELVEGGASGLIRWNTEKMITRVLAEADG